MKVFKDKPYLYNIHVGNSNYKAYKCHETIWNITPHEKIVKEKEGGKIVRLKLSNEYLSVGAAFCDKIIEAIKEHKNMLLVKLK